MTEETQLSSLTFDFFLWFILGLFFFIGIYFLFIIILQNNLLSNKGKSPFSGLPLRKGGELSFFAEKKLHEFYMSLPRHFNQTPKLDKSTICTSTGRIFPNSISKFGATSNPKDIFLNYPKGDYILWQELSDPLKKTIIENHDSIKGFQINQLPKYTKEQPLNHKFAHIKPGPLFVDLKTKALLGWKEIPETNLETLVYQPPTKAN